MTNGRRSVIALVLFLTGAGLMTAFESPWTLLGGLLVQLTAVGVGATTILTHEMLSVTDDSDDDRGSC